MGGCKVWPSLLEGLAKLRRLGDKCGADFSPADAEADFYGLILPDREFQLNLGTPGLLELVKFCRKGL
jgi:hypothetical protein